MWWKSVAIVEIKILPKVIYTIQDDSKLHGNILWADSRAKYKKLKFLTLESAPEILQCNFELQYIYLCL